MFMYIDKDAVEFTGTLAESQCTVFVYAFTTENMFLSYFHIRTYGLLFFFVATAGHATTFILSFPMDGQLSRFQLFCSFQAHPCTCLCAHK